MIWRGVRAMNSENVWRGKGVKIKFPLKYDEVAEDLRGSGAVLEVIDDYWVAEIPTSIAIPLLPSMGKDAFREFFSETVVENGRKRWIEEEETGIPTIEIIPRRDRIMSIRLSEAEYAMIKHVAQRLCCNDTTAWARKLLIKEAVEKILKRSHRLMPFH